MDEDRLMASLDEVDRTAAAAQAAIGETVRLFSFAREERRDGLPLIEMVDRMIARGGRDARIEASRAVDAYERAVMLLRGELVRSLVDDHGFTLTAVASRMGVARQVAARLYHAARADGPPQ